MLLWANANAKTWYRKGLFGYDSSQDSVVVLILPFGSAKRVISAVNTVWALYGIE